MSVKYPLMIEKILIIYLWKWPGIGLFLEEI